MKRNIQEILRKVNSLPYNFNTALKVSQMLEDVNVSISKLCEVISVDQALTVELLKLCNSAEYGFAKKISTVKDALSRIGFKPLKTKIFTIVSKGPLSKEMAGYGLERGDLWKNSISCAIYSRYLAELTGCVDPDQAFTAGLLRDIGKLVLSEYVKEDYEEILRIVNQEGIPFAEAEQRVLGFNHNQIGVFVGEKWKFPKLLIHAIKYHHNPEEAEKAKIEDLNLVKIVHLADYLSVILGYGIGTDGMMQSIDLESLDGLGLDLTPESMELLVSDMLNLNSEIEAQTSDLERGKN